MRQWWTCSLFSVLHFRKPSQSFPCSRRVRKYWRMDLWTQCRKERAGWMEEAASMYIQGSSFQGGASGKEHAWQCRTLERHRFSPWEGKWYATMCKVDNWWEAAIWHREPSLALCDDLEGWVGGRGGRKKGEGIYLHLWQICVVGQQKPTQYCKAIFPQLKINLKKERN